MHVTAQNVFLCSSWAFWYFVSMFDSKFTPFLWYYWPSGYYCYCIQPKNILVCCCCCVYQIVCIDAFSYISNNFSNTSEKIQMATLVCRSTFVVVLSFCSESEQFLFERFDIYGIERERKNCFAAIIHQQPHYLSWQIEILSSHPIHKRWNIREIEQLVDLQVLLVQLIST